MIKKTRTAILWLYLTQKRFLLRPLFLLLLCLVPLLSFAVGRMSSGADSIIRAALSCRNPSDEKVREIFARLTDGGSAAIKYYVCSDEEELREDIRSGKARLGFVFPEDTGALFDSFAAQETAGGGALSVLGSLLSGNSKETDAGSILVLAGNNDVVTKLSREQLYGKIYQDLSLAILKAWMDQHAGVFYMQKEERDLYLEETMAAYQMNENLFQLAYPDEELVSDRASSDYLSSPLRGLLAVLMVLTGSAAALVLMLDEKEGRLVWMKNGSRCIYRYFSILIPVADTAVFTLIALRFTGSFTGWGKEILLLALLCLSVTGFSCLLSCLVPGMTLYGALIPILVLACLFLTPVFLDLTFLRPLQALLPPWLYLNSVHGAVPLQSMCLYAVISGLLSLSADYFLRIRETPVFPAL